MKIAFVYDVDDNYWRDGLWAALNLLNKRWEISFYNLHNGAIPSGKFDFFLVWGALSSRQAKMVSLLEGKKGICLAGGKLNDPLIHSFDVVFAETLWQIKELRKINIDAVRAFGTNTDLFKPIKGYPKVWDAIYPAAFAKWKRHELFVKKPGFKLAVGYIQPNGVERECVDICERNGVMVLPQVTPNVLARLYNASRKVIITSDIWGGGERAVLEGLASGLHVEVEPDNPKLVELLAEQQEHLLTHIDYAKALRGGIENA